MSSDTHMENNCPCEAVKHLQKTVDDHEKRLADGNTNFALIQRDLQYIREKIEKRDKFNGKIFLYIIQSILTIILWYLVLNFRLEKFSSRITTSITPITHL